MKVNFKYDFGDIVYLRTDPDQCQRMVIGCKFQPEGKLFLLGLGNECTWHYEIEISSERNILITTNN